MEKYCHWVAENLKEQFLTLSLSLLDCVITAIPIQSKGNLCPHTVYSTPIDSPLFYVYVIFFVSLFLNYVSGIYRSV